MAYDNGGVSVLRPKPSGGRRRENITLEKRRASSSLNLLKPAGAGELLNIRELKIAYEEKIGHPTSDGTIYNLLARHEWRKLMPRPFHPKREAQEAYKKMIWGRRRDNALKSMRNVASLPTTMW
jgi:hypothetical protein